MPLTLRDFGVGLLGVISFLTLDRADKTFDLWDKAQTTFGWKADSVEISRSGEREEFTRKLLQGAYKRLYSVRYFGDIVTLGRPTQEVDQAWGRYAASMEEWDNNLMINLLGVEKWYGLARSQYLEQEISSLFIQSYWCMYDIRGSGRKTMDQTSLACKTGPVSPSYFEDKTNIFFTRQITNVLLQKLYCFSAGVQRPEPPNGVFVQALGGSARCKDSSSEGAPGPKTVQKS